MSVFHTQFDLEKLADALMPLIEERLNGNGRGRPAANEPDDWPSDEPADNAADDPWAEDEPQRQERPASRSQGRSAPRNGGSGRSSGGGRSGARSSGGNRSSRGNGGNRGGSGSDIPSSGTERDGNGKEWTFGLSDAPECACGLTAAEVTKPGASWAAWACPKGYSKNTYRDKCDLWEYQEN